MHIPDGFLDTKTWVSAAVVSGSVLAYGVRKTREQLNERQVPLMGVTAAFIFAAQMINFPIIGGTSGHLLGGVLAAILLGPWTASIVMTTILAVQAIFFGDGGITALGANVLNMAVVGTFSGYYIYLAINRMFQHNQTGQLFATFVASWFSVILAAIVASFELAFSGTIALPVALSAMGFWHVFIGLGEGIITTAVIAYLAKVRPDVIYEQAKL